MSNSNLSKTESDVSSNSSWDVIAESETSKSSSLEILINENGTDNRDCNVETHDTENNIENTFITIPDEEAMSKSEVFPQVEPSVDTYYHEKDTTTKSGSNKHSKTKPKCKKGGIKAGPLSAFAIVSSILTITVLTAFFLFTPSAEVQEMSEKTDTNDIRFNFDDSKLTDVVNNTAELMNTIDIINSYENLTEENGLTDEEMCYIEEEISNMSRTFDSNLLRPMPEPVANTNAQSRNRNTDYSRLGIQNVSMSLIKELKGVLMAPNFQLFLCTLMQDICLIRLVQQLEKKTASSSKSEDIPKKFDGKKVNKLKLEISKKLGEKKKHRNNKKVSKLKKALDLTFSNLSDPNQTVESTVHPMTREQIGNDSEVDNILWKKNQIVTHSKTENGKSECERRFEELDNKWECVGQSHRLKIQEIKEKFRNELHHIKENEKDFPLRKQRMKMIREKYAQRLRLDREVYLNQLRKLRDEKHVVLKDICKRKRTDVDSKDASIGNHALLLPESYDFRQKLLEVRKREMIGKTSHISTSFPVLHPGKSMDYSKNYSNSDILRMRDDELPNSYQNYMDNMRKYYQMRNATLEKNSKQIISSSGSSNSTEENEVPSEKNLSHSAILTSVSERNHSEVESTKPDSNIPDNFGKAHSKSKIYINKPKGKRALYDLAFDENGAKIMKSDDAVPSRAHRNSSPIFQALTKKDPKGPTKKLFTFKGKL